MLLRQCGKEARRCSASSPTPRRSSPGSREGGRSTCAYFRPSSVPDVNIPRQAPPVPRAPTCIDVAVVNVVDGRYGATARRRDAATARRRDGATYLCVHASVGIAVAPRPEHGSKIAMDPPESGAMVGTWQAVTAVRATSATPMPDLSAFCTPTAGSRWRPSARWRSCLGSTTSSSSSIMTAKLPQEQQPLARRIGLLLALGMRLLLLLAISWVMGLKATLLSLLGQDFSGRDLILLVWRRVPDWQGDPRDVRQARGRRSRRRRPKAKSARSSPSSPRSCCSTSSSRSTRSSPPSAWRSTSAIMMVAMFIAVGVMLVFAGASARSSSATRA